MDESLNLFLMEVNMSPNLTPMHGHPEHNSVIYEQLIYNTLKLIGAGSYFEMMEG
jgi:tubulin monoglycylase TTLL15